TIDLAVHWQGGDHTRLTVPKNRTGQHRLTTGAETGELIRALSRQQPDAGIAAILNRYGERTGKGNTWTESRVRSHRSAHGIAVYRDGEMAERGELTLEETARRLTVSKMTVLRLIDSGVIPARQACKGAPWAIPEVELAGLDARAALIRRPQPENADQQSLMFQ
ncbi:MAG: helix-turn-helix domain-containing protein, partial [Stellaceae bacterium]